MPAHPPPAFDASTLQSIAAQLACPACLGDLRLEDRHLVCAACSRRYPVVDGIPVLTAEKSIAPSQTVSNATSSTPAATTRTE